METNAICKQQQLNDDHRSVIPQSSSIITASTEYSYSSKKLVITNATCIDNAILLNPATNFYQNHQNERPESMRKKLHISLKLTGKSGLKWQLLWILILLHTILTEIFTSMQVYSGKFNHKQTNSVSLFIVAETMRLKPEQMLAIGFNESEIESINSNATLKPTTNSSIKFVDDLLSQANAISNTNANFNPNTTLTRTILSDIGQQPSVGWEFESRLVSWISFMNVIICVVGICGNLIVILVILEYTKCVTVNDIYIVNLAFADLMFVTGLIFLIITMHLEIWIFGNAMCKVSS